MQAANAIFRICSESDCTNRARARGLCQKHYNYSLRAPTCDLLSIGKKGTALSFIQSIIGTDSQECIVWPFKSRTGLYGALRFRGKGKFPAHRCMLILSSGEPPCSKMQAAHACSNKLCVNPNHLRWLSRSDNITESFVHRMAGVPTTGTPEALKYAEDLVSGMPLAALNHTLPLLLARLASDYQNKGGNLVDLISTAISIHKNIQSQKK